MAWVHRLVEKDPETLRGVCAHCGPVALRRDRGGVRCDVAWREQHRSSHRNEYKAPVGECDLCGRETKLHRDHDHTHCPGGSKSSGCPTCHRGMLCVGCNTSLGWFGDDPARLRSAIEYLERHKSVDAPETRPPTV